MDSGELISEGFNLMFLGMGTVFVFLTILVLVTTLMSALVKKYSPALSDSKVSGGEINDQTLLAVISAAIHTHRKRK